MENPKLLIIEDNESIRTQMKWALTGSYEVLAAVDRKGGLQLFSQNNPRLVTLDLGLPPDEDGVSEGFMALANMKEMDPHAKVIVITGRQEKEHALRAIDQGAYDFFLKPIEVDELKVVLRRALHVQQLERENLRLQAELHRDAFSSFLGTSPQMEDVFRKIKKVAPTNVPVLITGESGTGKELAAKAIHDLSPRKSGPFVGINCGAIPENLLESELFGHEKGAFTGAHAQKKGRIELGEGGTVLLDEIGELPPDLQVKLLRFLQEQAIVRVGGQKEIPTDVRIVSATNTDLEAAMNKKLFREDLYFRLAVVTIAMPNLKEREGDISLLAKAFLLRFSKELKKKVTTFTTDGNKALLSHNWPGNVRELENRVKRAVIMTESNKITAADLELESAYSKYRGMDLKRAREAVEKELIQHALTTHKRNITRTALELGVSRPTLYELMEKLGIK